MVNPLNSVNSRTEALSGSSSAPVDKTATVTTAAGQRAAPQTAEKVNVSGRGHMAGTLNQAARDSNGVDPARVQAIRDQMGNGSNTVSAKDIAAAMIKAHGPG